jgi:hypothetical protein
MKIEAGQVAVVTGGTSGIGFGLATVLARRGVNVMIADVREDAIPTAVDALSRQSGRVVGVHADVSIDADMDALADETIERFGRVDLVCNNAGVVGQQAPMWEQRLQNWRWLIDVKADGCRARSANIRTTVHRAGLRTLSEHGVRGRLDGVAHPRALQRNHARGRRSDRDVGCRTQVCFKGSWRYRVVSGNGGHPARRELRSIGTARRGDDCCRGPGHGGAGCDQSPARGASGDRRR